MSVAPVNTGVRQPNPLLVFVTSSIGKKWIVAISGSLLVLFVLAHLAGNLSIYIGPYGEGINLYAQALHASQLFLWSARGGLLLVFLIHILTTLSLVHENMRAKPKRYAVKAHVQSTVFVRTMILSALVVLSFLIFHVLQFAAGMSPYSHLVDLQGRHDVAAMIILSFHNPLVAGFYLLSLVLLGMHMSHGISSLFQTFGANGRKTSGTIKCCAILAAWVLMAGFASIPVAAVTGYLKVLPSDQRPSQELTATH